MRHFLWLMPLALGIILMWWCVSPDLTQSGIIVSIFLVFISGMGFSLMLLDKMDDNHVGG